MKSRSLCGFGRAAALGARFTSRLPPASRALARSSISAGDVGVGWAAVRRVVLEAAVLGRVVRGGDQDAVGEAVGAAAVVPQDGVRDDRRRRHAVVAGNEGHHAVGGQHFEGRCLGGGGKRVGVAAHEQRPVDATAAAVVADRLGDRQDMRGGEGALERAATVPGGAELHAPARGPPGRDGCRGKPRSGGRCRPAGWPVPVCRREEKLPWCPSLRLSAG